MSRTSSVVVLAALAFVFAASDISCSAVRSVQQAMGNLLRTQFKIDGVSDFTLLGIPLSGKRSISVEDGLRLLPAFRDKRFPASFNLNIAAMNPDTGAGGSSGSSPVTLSGLAWTLLIDSTETISGDLASPVAVPGRGQRVTIPLRMDLDLYKFFGQRGYEGLLNLAMGIGGSSPNLSRVQLRAKPTIQTSMGPVTYPGTITIVDSEFRGQ